MASTRWLDVEQFWKPISAESPSGEWLRYDPLYDELRKARDQSDRDMLGSEAESEEPDWAVVIELATDALQRRSKDLLIAAWLAEAMMERHGFGGLRDALTLIRGLLERFWDTVYPLPDEDDLEPRVAPLVWLFDQDGGALLPNRLRDVPLLGNPEEGYSWNTWKSRYCPPRRDNEEEDVYERRREAAASSETQFEAAVSAATAEQIFALNESLDELKEAFQQLDKTATERFGELAPGVSGFRSALEEIQTLVRRLVRDKGGVAEPAGGAEAGATAAAAQGANGKPAAAGSGPIQSREDAFIRLHQVAEYLRKAEPQSPIPALIDRAIAWGRMPFHQLLREMIRDSSARDQVRDLLGLGGDNDSE